MGSNHYLARLINEDIANEHPEFLAEIGGVREKWSPSAMIDFRNGGLRQFIKITRTNISKRIRMRKFTRYLMPILLHLLTTNIL